MSTTTLTSEDLHLSLVETRVNEAYDFVAAAPSVLPARIELAIAPSSPAPARRYLRPSAHWADRWLTVTKP